MASLPLIDQVQCFYQALVYGIKRLSFYAMSNFLPESKFFDKLLTQLLGESVLVLGHRRPDGDCVGSQVAFTRALLGMGIDARAVNQDSAPRTLKKFIGDTPFLQPNEIEDSEALIITVDCADHARVGEELMNRFPSVLLNIDHHVSNTHYAKNNFVFADASATAEILASHSRPIALSSRTCALPLRFAWRRTSFRSVSARFAAAPFHVRICPFAHSR